MGALSDAKVGDKLLVYTRYSTKNEGRIYTVDRVTKTRVVCTYGAAFTVSTGALIGNAHFSRAYARLATDAEVAETIRMSELRTLKELVLNETLSANADTVILRMINKLISDIIAGG